MSALNSDRGCLSQNVLHCLFSFPLICFCPLCLSCPMFCVALMLLILRSYVFSLAQVFNLILFSLALSCLLFSSHFLLCITLSECNTDRGSERDLKSISVSSSNSHVRLIICSLWHRFSVSTLRLLLYQSQKFAMDPALVDSLLNVL